MVLFYMLEIIAVIMIFYAATLLLNVEWDFCQERNGKDKNIVSIGRLEPQKNNELLIRAFKK